MERTESKEIAGWGRTPRLVCDIYRPERRDAPAAIFAAGERRSYIARGLGRSYGDPSLNAEGAVIDMTRLNRMYDFDRNAAVLHCEGGVSFADIIEHFLPRGYFPPVTPGTKFVTVGGAIANDVHGKNHHAHGCFSEFVLDFELLTPSGAVLTCSREENADVFWATVGGVGLTGIILSARFKLSPVDSAYWIVDRYQARNLDDLLDRMIATQDGYDCSVAWVDCLAKGASLGRSVLLNGRNARPDELGPEYGAPFAPPKKKARAIPVDFPGFALNPWSVRAFNEFFYRNHPTRDRVIEDYDAYFYPLDALLRWNRMYGKRGFTQYQATLPFSARAGLVDLLERVSRSGRASFLAVLKCFGPANDGLLSHPFEGFTLTLDFPMRPDLPPFLHELDALLLEHGGRIYLAKDACCTPETFAAMYPRLDEFRAVKAKVDPENRLQSHLSRRLRIAP